MDTTDSELILQYLFFCILMFILIYFINKSIRYYLNQPYIEGMTTNNDNNTNNNNGIAGNSSNYATQIKDQTVQLQDQLLISKYRSDYETILLNLDDYLNVKMLELFLSLSPNNLSKQLHSISIMQQTKRSISDILKFIDNN